MKYIVVANWVNTYKLLPITNAVARELFRIARLRVPIAQSEGNPKGNTIPAIPTLIF